MVVFKWQNKPAALVCLAESIWRRRESALAVSCAAGLATLTGAAFAHPSSSSSSHASSAPARSVSSSAPHVGGGGGVHMPGGMGGGAHIPGGGGGSGGAHMPSSMAAHVPSSVHVPGSAHVPGGTHEPGSTHVPGSGRGQSGHTQLARADRGRGEANRITQRGGHEGTAEGRTAEHGARADEHGDRVARDAASPQRQAEHAAYQRDRGFQAARHDVRLGGEAKLNTRGIEAGLAVPRAPRPFLRLDAHRDIARDRAFVEAHRGDFHTRFARDFTARELAAWRRGVWRNEWHYGRRGWWYEVDNVWYDYPDPVEPYPEDVADLTVYDTPVVDGPDVSADEALPPAQDVAVVGAGEAVYAAAPPPAGVAPDPASPPVQVADAGTAAAPIGPLPAAPAGWYHCEGPQGYYPGISACVPGWNLVQTPPLPGEQ